MKISNQATDLLIMRELGERFARLRLERNLTQSALAEQAGISKRTVERMEAGGPTQLVNLVRVCRALNLLDRFDALIPEPMTSPVVLLKQQGKKRHRARTKPPAAPPPKWEWNDKR